jgi:hypothetical protein
MMRRICKKETEERNMIVGWCGEERKVKYNEMMVSRTRKAKNERKGN